MRHGFAAFLLALLALPAKVHAQGAGPLDPAERSIAVDLMAGQQLDHLNHGGYSEFVSPSLTVSRPLSRRLEGSINLQPALLVNQPTKQPPTDERQTVWAAVLDVGLRWYPFPARWSWQPFVEVNAGILGASHRVPARGTDFNFNAQSGVGVLLPYGERWHPYIAARWYHISNGNLGYRNPSWDYWAVVAGGKLSFKPS